MQEALSLPAGKPNFSGMGVKREGRRAEILHVRRKDDALLYYGISASCLGLYISKFLWIGLALNERTFHPSRSCGNDVLLATRLLLLNEAIVAKVEKIALIVVEK